MATISMARHGKWKTDHTAPVVTGFVIPSTGSDLTVAISTFTVTGTPYEYLITESAVKPSTEDPGWSTTKPTTYECAKDGAHTLYAWARDAAGNISASANDAITLTVIATPTDILLSNFIVDEGDTEVGTLSTVNWAYTHETVYTYTLVSGAGSTDNALFQVTANDPADLEATLEFKIASTAGWKTCRIRSTGTVSGEYTEKIFRINARPV